MSVLARHLGVERILLAAGATVVPHLDLYDERTPEPLRIEVDKSVSGVAGSLNIAHPRACSALAEAARTAGADIRWGVHDVRIKTGERPQVRWTTSDGIDQEASCGLVVGADGRRSSVRSQAAIGLQIDPPAHLMAGMLVEAVGGMDLGVNVIARESDLMFYSFPSKTDDRGSTFPFQPTKRLALQAARGQSVSFTPAGSVVSTVWRTGGQHVRPDRAGRFPAKTAVRSPRSATESF